MAQQNQVLCIDVGGDSIKAAEFSYIPGESLILERFAYSEYGTEDGQISKETVIQTLTEVLSVNNFAAKDVHVSISGNNAFIRFVKIPAMTTDKDKIREIIAYEAKQTIPFPMNEVVWDSQMIEAPEEEGGNEIDAMLVIVKNEEVARIVDAVEKFGKRVNLIEVAATASYNSARANGIGDTQCEMLLNIGGHCSTLVFIDGERFFVRTIPIAGDAITQQIAKEFNIPYEEAEEMKRKHGFVALGGAYEEPDSEVAATVSKIVRNIMTRLHGEINRSINVYRASQHGRKPEKLYLSGGSSILPYAPRFFSEKLRIPVDYFNPFQIINLGEDVDQELLRDVAHLYGETIGLALRRIGSSPIEISLTPEHIKKQYAFNMKRPYFYATAVVALLALGISFWSSDHQKGVIQAKERKFSQFTQEKERIQSAVRRANSTLQETQKQYQETLALLARRNNWIAFYELFQNCIPPNVWFSSISVAALPDDNPFRTQSEEEAAARKRSAAQEEELPEGEQLPTEPIWLNLDGYVLCRSRSSKGADTSAAINVFQGKLSNSGLFDIKSNEEFNTHYFDDIAHDYNVNVRHFHLSVPLKHPINSAEFEQLLSERLAMRDAQAEAPAEAAAPEAGADGAEP